MHHTEYLHVNIPKRYALVNVTKEVEEVVRRSGVMDGFCFVSAMHITAGVYINDAETGLLNDISKWIENLAPVMLLDIYKLKISIAILTALHRMDFNIIRIIPHLQRVPLMPRLSTTFPTAGLSQTASAWFLQPVTRRRLAAVLTVFCQLVFQGMDRFLRHRI